MKHRQKCTQSRARLRHFLHLITLSLVLAVSFSPSLLQAAPSTPASIVAETEETPKSPPEPTDPLGRITPRGTFEGYIKAVSRENYGRAARYLDLAPLPLHQRIRAEQMARILQQALDRNGDIPPAVMLSEEPAGNTDDDLPPESERIGSLTIGDKDVPILLQRLHSAEGPIWLISSKTLAMLPRSIDAQSALPINQLLPDTLIENRWNGVPWGHWVAMLVLALITYLFSSVIVSVIAGLARLALARKFGSYPAGLVKAFAIPVQLFVAVWAFVAVAQRAGISIIVRQYLGEVVVIVAWISVLWLVWRLVDVIAAALERRLTTQARFGALSAVVLLRRSSRFLLVAVGLIVALATAGVNVTTGLAALGIGGIAVALGAQKMVENLVGSMTLVFDQPARIGDFCKVGETLGTIERIGMRSTRVRTLDRTLITIPNGEFAAQKIENYAHRDRFLFHTTFGIHYDTSPDQIRYLLSELRTVLETTPQVVPDPARVRFLGFGGSSLEIEVFAYVLACDYDEYLATREDLNLEITDVMQRSGTGFAYPSQTLYVANGPGQPQESPFPFGNTNQQASRERGAIPLRAREPADEEAFTAPLETANGWSKP